MLSKTLAQYRAAVVYEAGIGGAVGVGETYRHDQDQLDAELNSTFQAFREELTSRDFPFYVEETEQEALPTERADTNEQYSLIDWPTTAHEIRRIDVYMRGEWESLVPVDWARVRDVTPRSNHSAQRPRFYAVKKQGTPNSFEGVDGTEYEVEAGKIALLPFATGGVYKMSYLPVWSYALDEDELFVFPSEFGFRWCVWECVKRISVRDRNAGKRGTEAEKERLWCETKLGRYVPRIVNTGGSTMRRSPRYNG
jgi:hypothetical protein